MKTKKILVLFLALLMLSSTLLIGTGCIGKTIDKEVSDKYGVVKLTLRKTFVSGSTPDPEIHNPDAYCYDYKIEVTNKDSKTVTAKVTSLKVVQASRTTNLACGRSIGLASDEKRTILEDEFVDHDLENATFQVECSIGGKSYSLSLSF